MLGTILGAVAPILGSAVSGLFGKSQQDSNAASQREFAQRGIRWKVADAKAAGIHPLYALGAQTHSFSPSPIMQNDFGITQAGQNLSRSLAAQKTPLQKQLAQLELEKAKAEVDYIKAQTAASVARTIRAPGSPPGVPGTPDLPGAIPGQNIDLRPAEVETRMPGVPQSRAGAIPLYQFVQKGPNEWHYTINPNAIEPDSFQGIMATLAGVADPPRPPPGMLKPGHEWKWNEFAATWSMVPRKNRRALKTRQQWRHGR
jgi:hypothetical protein